MDDVYQNSNMIFSFIVDIFFPPVCLACHRKITSGVICDACFKAIPRLPMPPQDTPFTFGAAVNYESPVVKALIHHLKFKSVKNASIPLAQLLMSFIRDSHIDLSNFLIVPIPISERRKRARGFNQAELIAQEIAMAFALPINTHSLIRTKHTKPQSDTKTAEERKENIRGVYAVRNPEAIQGKPILLIDDVSTSGSTFKEAAATLTALGTRNIIALAVAKPERSAVVK
jgi:ComF family protein